MSDYFEREEAGFLRTDLPKTRFYSVWAGFESGKTKNVEIQATSSIEAYRKALQFYPDAVRVLISL